MKDTEVVEGATHESERGKFQIFTAPAIRRPVSADHATDDDMSAALALMDYSGLLGPNSEDEVRATVTDMLRALVPGSAVTVLFGQRGPKGMSLGHAWFGPNLPLYRHSHPKFGDCLYYVLAGEIMLGRQVLKPGDGFFVPNGMPYKYRAGPDGCEVLEFRAGGGIKGAPHTRIDEASLDALKRVAEMCRANHHRWARPPVVVSDGALMSKA